MGFEDLSRLWLLLLLPVLWWLARPPSPKRRVSTPHLVQWRAALARLRRRPVRFRRLRFLLLVIAVLALIAAASGLRLDPTPGPRRLVIALDASASMGVSGGWEEARSALAAVLDEVPEHVEVRLALCGATVVLAEDGDLLAAFPVRPESAPGRVDLARFAADVVDPQVAVCTITDGLGPASAPTDGALRLVGKPRPNVAIVRAAVADAWPLPAVEVEIEVAAFGTALDSVELIASLGSIEVARTPCPVATGRGVARLAFERGRGGLLEVRLASDGGALDVDDRVVFELAPPPAPDVLVLGDAEAAPGLGAAAEVLAELGGGRVVAGEAERAGFVLVDGGGLEELPLRAILFGARVGIDALATAPRESPVVIDWDRADPLLAGIDLSELRVRTALPVESLPEGRVLVRGERGPLVVAVDRPDGARTLCFGFRLGDSNLALLPALPQILRRAYRAAWGDRAAVAAAPDNLCDAAESDLRSDRMRRDRPLPPFGGPGRPLAVPLVLLALLALALRILT